MSWAVGIQPRYSWVVPPAKGARVSRLVAEHWPAPQDAASFWLCGPGLVTREFPPWWHRGREDVHYGRLCILSPADWLPGA